MAADRVLAGSRADALSAENRPEAPAGKLRAELDVGQLEASGADERALRFSNLRRRGQ